MSIEIHPEKLIQLGRAVIDTETEAVAELNSRIDNDFVQACKYILGCEGRTVVIGMGKSGHIGSKIAATLASTGTPAFFVHPGEASHGDLGMITVKDVVICLSNSGETDEITNILPLIKRLQVPLISMTGNAESTLASAANVNLDVGVDKEACPLGLAPTSSTTAALVMGDALAVALLESRGFSADDFALAHPGGSLGRRLLLHVNDIMHTDDELPKVYPNTPLKDALLEMTNKGLGVTAIVDEAEKVIGIYTDGDLRRSLDKNVDMNSSTVADFMTQGCKTISADALAASALALMEENKINALLVVDDQQTLCGVLNMHDLLKARVV